MDARSVMIHQVQFSSFFLFISHMPVKAAAEVNESASGTVLSVNFFNTMKRTIQQTAKNNKVFRQSLPFDFVMIRAVWPSFFLAHMNQPMILITV